MISPDSNRVVYLASQETEGVLELFSVLLAGTPEEAVRDLVIDTQTLVAAGRISEDQGDGLEAKLSAVLTSITEGRIAPACNQLGSFINQIEAMVHDSTLSPAEAQELRGAADAIRATLGC